MRTTIKQKIKLHETWDALIEAVSSLDAALAAYPFEDKWLENAIKTRESIYDLMENIDLRINQSITKK